MDAFECGHGKPNDSIADLDQDHSLIQITPNHTQHFLEGVGFSEFSKSALFPKFPNS